MWSPPDDMRGPFDAWAATTGTDWATYTRERPGVSAFALEDGAVYHTYSAYARGLDGLWGMYQWLDRAPRGRNEARGPDDPLELLPPPRRVRQRISHGEPSYADWIRYGTPQRIRWRADTSQGRYESQNARLPR